MLGSDPRELVSFYRRVHLSFFGGGEYIHTAISQAFGRS